ncbi:hypothetical protein JTE90_018191 [Oedothorax gibbosus]|uniref:Uncharacterized protein n=1 Tax=Oedothorax gibbosus TaxID=931172 RepID=A0AAV6U914_9ARAC|nr:hypothetical protein JTE90_018191 [Oedothorax gibbosus]
MAVKEGLTYCPRRDCVEGLETTNVNPEQDVKPLRASHALVFMARGIKKNWKQVLGYFFTSKGASKNVDTVKWVTQSIDILKGCNLKVITTVCDQGPANLVGNETQRKMTASWDQIEKLYEHDNEQVLSHSVASALSLLSSGLMTPGFGAESYFTAEFVGTMNFLFDSLNSKVPYSNKPHHGAARTDSGHLELWQSMVSWIETWEFRDARGKKISPASKKGWIMTLRAMEGIWKSLEGYQMKYLLLNRFNQDCLENTLSFRRRRGGGPGHS